MRWCDIFSDRMKTEETFAANDVMEKIKKLLDRAKENGLETRGHPSVPSSFLMVDEARGLVSKKWCDPVYSLAQGISRSAAELLQNGLTDAGGKVQIIVRHHPSLGALSNEFGQVELSGPISGIGLVAEVTTTNSGRCFSQIDLPSKYLVKNPSDPAVRALSLALKDRELEAQTKDAWGLVNLAAAALGISLE